ncbi:hypothetical protein FHX74_003098 [Friedmanniella endophytica]|uniref:CAAX prenyl protease 2/Lysostaphin resistance protein A-like domain-containing protein n=1 Tax=Microlunatus kandeliicorticis TaxID=1759536 RepID=A0A7W3P6Z8_9ACTN|nr:type II CAAX endopeptidase family protein [Microlunatus kandeliicorticis]MBA8795462.1 hypothetical protein [Microlunatus kandeliicorticis]
MSKKRRPGSRRSGNPAAPPRPTSRGGSQAARTPSPARTAGAAIPGEELLGSEQQPPEGALYPQVLRTSGRDWRRSIGGLALALAFYAILPAVIIQLVVLVSFGVVDLVAEPPAYRTFFAQAIAFERPSGMLAQNLAIATLIPISMFLVGFVHRVRPRWLSSVRPRLRWGYLAPCLLVALLAIGGVTALTLFASGPTVFRPQPGFAGFLVVILLTSPVQALAEEYFFRGYLLQVFGSLVANPWFAIVASSVVFAIFHGIQSPALFVDRLGFGLLAALLVRLTGGLEAGIAAHVVNNVLAFTLAGLTGSIAAVHAISTISWLNAAADVGSFALFAALAWLVGRRMGLQTRVGAGLGTGGLVR